MQTLHTASRAQLDNPVQQRHRHRAPCPWSGRLVSPATAITRRTLVLNAAMAATAGKPIDCKAAVAWEVHQVSSFRAPQLGGHYNRSMCALPVAIPRIVIINIIITSPPHLAGKEATGGANGDCGSARTWRGSHQDHRNGALPHGAACHLSAVVFCALMDNNQQRKKKGLFPGGQA